MADRACARHHPRGARPCGYLPAEPAIILSKHQSAWETVALQDLVPERTYCVFVLKKELLRLPFFGWGWRRCR